MNLAYNWKSNLMLIKKCERKAAKTNSLPGIQWMFNFNFETFFALFSLVLLFIDHLKPLDCRDDLNIDHWKLLMWIENEEKKGLKIWDSINFNYQETMANLFCWGMSVSIKSYLRCVLAQFISFFWKTSSVSLFFSKVLWQNWIKSFDLTISKGVNYYLWGVMTHLKFTNVLSCRIIEDLICEFKIEFKISLKKFKI